MNTVKKLGSYGLNPISIDIQPNRTIGGIARNPLSSCNLSNLNLQFLITFPGVLKVIEATVGGTCGNLTFPSGIPFTYNRKIGTLLFTCSVSVSIVLLLLFCYLVSQRTVVQLRSSLFELVFNFTAAVLYCVSSCLIYFDTNFTSFIWSFFSSFVTGELPLPKMCIAYILGFFLAIIHGVDAYKCYKALYK